MDQVDRKLSIQASSAHYEFELANFSL